jgi:hypothetical protein
MKTYSLYIYIHAAYISINIGIGFTTKQALCMFQNVKMKPVFSGKYEYIRIKLMIWDQQRDKKWRLVTSLQKLGISIL